MKTISSLKTISKHVSNLKAEGKVIGLATGVFDILHVGHIKLLKDAKEVVDILIVGLENDETVKLTKGANRPINSINDRLSVVSSLKYVDFAFPISRTYKYEREGDLSEIKLVQKEITDTLKPDYLITAFSGEYPSVEKKKDAASWGLKLLEIQPVSDVSSSKLIEELGF